MTAEIRTETEVSGASTSGQGPIPTQALACRSGGPLRVLHILYRSVPHGNGYTIRSKHIVDTLCAEGRFQPTVLTSPFSPGDPSTIQDETLDGVEYYRCPHPCDFDGRLDIEDVISLAVLRFKRICRKALSALRCLRFGLSCVLRPGAAKTPVSSEACTQQFSADRKKSHRLERWAGACLRAAEDALLRRRMRRNIIRLCRRIGPDVIHAHSPYRCGLPALQVAGELGLPFVYEVRGLWEDSARVEGHWTAQDREYVAWRRKETAVMLQADAVICVCEQLRNEVVSRGVPIDRVFVAPNAVCSESLEPVEPGETLPSQIESIRERLGGCTLGYIGSIRPLEAVEDLLRAAAVLVRRGQDVSVLVVGAGVGLHGLKQLASNLGLGDRVVFPGRVAHQQIRFYYDSIDIFAVTRRSNDVTRLVTPLKPLEAMAMRKALIVSDLPALRELVTDQQTGLFYRAGNPTDLADQCETLIRDPSLRCRLGEQARQWVGTKRTWPQALQSYDHAYATAIHNATLRQAGVRPI